MNRTIRDCTVWWLTPENERVSAEHVDARVTDAAVLIDYGDGDTCIVPWHRIHAIDSTRRGVLDLFYPGSDKLR